ncbi:thioredoxin fold domain-containing protein [Photobacterium damselae]|uniref:thioredoxin fold domain-containing protein n=1 Tax=Photobacterium damselae TaxID=38293 RepID=UPI0015A0D9F0|nr:thioredoxin fold domain-containing protein [Photobacterium damselae]NVO60223.1 thioredoxin fold domain-containing protein [Photobacterium damselae subsp. damselae]
MKSRFSVMAALLGAVVCGGTSAANNNTDAKPMMERLSDSGADTVSSGVAIKSSVANPPPQLAALINQGVVNLIESFKHGNYNGYLVESSGEYHLYWGTSDNMIIAGPLIDSNGINLTDRFLDKKIPKPDFTSLYGELEQSEALISTDPSYKDDKGVLYVFVEPFCGWCARIHNELEPLIKDGLVVKWVPVSFLSGSSSGVVQYVLEQSKPIEAWDNHVNNLKKAEPMVSVVTEKTTDLLNHNADLMHRFGVKGTPGLVYKMNGEVHVGSFMDKDSMAALAEKLKQERAK